MWEKCQRKTSTDYGKRHRSRQRECTDYWFSWFGKGQAYVYPNLINNTEETIICSDPKGELYRDTHLIKQDQGYRVYLVDFVDFINCHRYNPLDNVKDDIDARAVANIIAKNAAEGNRDFWTKSALSFLSAIILYVKMNIKIKRI